MLSRIYCHTCPSFSAASADNRCVVIADGQLSAQFEHTVAVTGSGVKVLTLRPGETMPV